MQVNLFDETERLTERLFEIIKKTAVEAGNFQGLDKESSVDILVTDSESIREINKDKRKIDKVTDVLSFPMVKGTPGSYPVFLGDIVICLEKIYGQASEYGHSPEREAGFLTAHGMLHLMGYDHMTDEDEKEMFEKQEIILGRLNLKR